MLEKKNELIKLFKETKDLYTKKNIEYKKAKYKLLLETDFNNVLNKSRPTVDEKNAFVDLNTIELREEKELLYNKIEYIKYQIELCTDEIELDMVFK